MEVFRGKISRAVATEGNIKIAVVSASEELTGRSEQNIALMDQLTIILDEEVDEMVIAQVLRGPELRVLSLETMEYRCYCNRERVAEALRSIGAEAIREMAASGKFTEVECQFCSAKYAFTAERFTALLC